MKKKALWMLILLSALIVCGAADAQAQFESAQILALHSSDGVSDVNVRTQPSMDAPLRGVYHCGVRVEAIGQQDGWVEVVIGGADASMHGYVLEKYVSQVEPETDEQGLAVMRLSDAQETWVFAAQPWDYEKTPPMRLDDGAFELGTEGWPVLAAGTLCVALGEVEDGAWTHVRIGLDRYGFIRTQALEDTGLVSLTAARIPRAGLLTVHPGTPYAMPVYAAANDSTALWPTLREGDTLEYIACLDGWIQVAIGNLLECAFIPAEYATVYPYEALFSVDAALADGVHEIKAPGLYTFSCVGSGRLEIACDAYTRVYEGDGMYSMYLPQGARATVADGMLSGISTDIRLEDLSRDGVGAWDEMHGSGRYLAGVHMEADLWREARYIVTAQEGKACGYYRTENLDQDAGIQAQSEWIPIEAGEVAALSLYAGQFIELRDASLFYFSGNG